MITTISTLLAVAALANALPPAFNGGDVGGGVLIMMNGSNSSYSLPMFDPNAAARAAEIADDRAGYLYQPSLIGNSSFFLGGPKGGQLVQTDIGLWTNDATPQRTAVQDEAVLVRQSLAAAGGIQNLSSFDLLYQDQWKTANPDGISPGILTNYSQDLLFAMERLSSNPFPIRRIRPNDMLPFDVDDQIVQNVTSASLTDLHAAGRLFIVDHSYQANYSVVKGRFNAACTAYFFIHPSSGDLLPLAIKTNVGSDLVYTPLDEEQDWLLAKMMFNVNDQFHAQILHLGNSHAVAEIVHEAALRTMSSRHPIHGYLDNIMYQAYAIRPIGAQILFNPGGLFDQNFALDHVAVEQFVADFYPTEAGPVQANYFHTNLANRGMIDCDYGPQLAHFPWAEDAEAIVNVLREFATSFVNYYYYNESLVSQDQELQAWASEATGAAEVIDFPASPILSRETIIDILTHLAYLTGVNHHTLNSGSLAANSGVLPFHPAALYAPIPDAKGVESVLPYLPNTNASVNQATLFAGFVRPRLFGSDGDLESIFELPGFLAGASRKVKRAAAQLQSRLRAISNDIQTRSFDDEGLAQGMPFIWQNLDPGKVPFFLAI